MRRSALFARLFRVILLAILATAVTTVILYTALSRRVFTHLQEEELFGKARILANMSAGDRASLLDQERLADGGPELSARSADLFGAYLLVLDGQDNLETVSDELPETLRLRVLDAADVVRSRGEVRTADIPALRGTSTVCVGVAGGDAVVFLLVPMYEALLAQTSLNWALILSLSLSIPLASLLLYQVTRRIVRPIRRMRDVALNMAGGNFHEKADDTQFGEVGQLGHSLNHLSEQLDYMISNLVVERNRLEMTIDGLREGIVSLNGKGEITHSNPAVGTLFESLGRDASQEADPKLRLIPLPGVWSDFEAVLRGGDDVEKPLTLSDRTVQEHLSALRDESGQTVGAVGLFTDVTESDRLERTRREYVANVSHELRSPLTAMRALVEPLNDGIVTEESTRKRYYGIILREILRLSRLIDDLMQLSRLQSDSAPICPEIVSPGALLADVEERYASAAEDRELRFSLSQAVSQCPPCLVNRDRLEQILVILIDNAMKYTPAGGEVGVDARWDETRVTLLVWDTGIGIDPADQPYIFDRFFKADKAHSGLGSGLGLSIARELVNRMGGSIGVRSRPGEGSQFRVTLPRAERDSGEAANE